MTLLYIVFVLMFVGTAVNWKLIFDNRRILIDLNQRELRLLQDEADIANIKEQITALSSAYFQDTSRKEVPKHAALLEAHTKQLDDHEREIKDHDSRIRENKRRLDAVSSDGK